MTNESTYETIDWELEAKRIARAFGLSDECYFQKCQEFDGEEFMWLRLEGDNPDPVLPSKELFCVTYTRKMKNYAVIVPKLRFAVSEAEFSWDGQLISSVFDPCHALLFARALLRLGLLTPEVEAALKITVSAHQKMEWTLEDEAPFAP